MKKQHESKTQKLERLRKKMESNHSKTKLRQQQKKHIAEEHNTSPSLSSSLLSITIVSFSTLVSSLSVPIFAILLQTNWQSSENISLIQKIIVPLIAYIKIILPRQWLLWNSIGHRLNGKPDFEILAETTIEQENDRSRVSMALLACNTGFTNGFLATFLALKTAPRSVAWSVSILLGLLNFLVDLYTELPDAFRKHVESKQNVSHFFHQKHIIDSATPFAYCFGIAMREGLPPIAGLIGAQAAIQALNTITDSSLSIPALTPLAISMYFAMAYSTQFKLIQLRDNLRAEEIDLNINNCLSQSSVSAIKLSGNIISGQIMVAMLKRCKLTIDASVNTTLALATIGLSALLYSALHQWVSSTNAAAVQADQEGLAMSYMLGKSSALQLAPKLEVAMGCIAVTFAVISMFTKSATLRKQEQENRQQKVYSTADNTEQSDIEALRPNL